MKNKNELTKNVKTKKTIIIDRYMQVALKKENDKKYNNDTMMMTTTKTTIANDDIMPWCVCVCCACLYV